MSSTVRPSRLALAVVVLTLCTVATLYLVHQKVCAGVVRE